MKYETQFLFCHAVKVTGWGRVKKGVMVQLPTFANLGKADVKIRCRTVLDLRFKVLAFNVKLCD